MRTAHQPNSLATLLCRGISETGRHRQRPLERLKTQTLKTITMKKHYLLILSILAIELLVGQLALSQTPDVSATVQFSTGETFAITDTSTSIGLQPNELVNVTIQFAADAVGEPVVVEAPDGGTTSVGSSIPVVGADGTLTFAFVAPSHGGQNSICIRTGSRSFCLQFSVAEPANQ
jgi:hypothetical protein